MKPTERLQELFRLPAFELEQANKMEHIWPILSKIHAHHYRHCMAYAQVSKTVFGKSETVSQVQDMPFLPVNLFKTRALRSIEEDKIFKILKSSGTTGQEPSKIYLDTETAKLQSAALHHVMASVIGKTRLPMLVIDSKSVLTNRSSYSARGAGILGMSVFGKDHTYLLNAEMEIDQAAVLAFKEKYNGKEILLFGFTYLVWQYLSELNLDLDLSKAILIHSGGWKKMIEQKVDNVEFRQKLKERFGLEKIHNFYGMVEQVGGVYLENNNLELNAPLFTEIIIRNPKDLSVQPQGSEGLIQTISVLPWSYPGHSILTEDIGVITQENSNKSWNGKAFKVLGRAKKAELRGCSDTFKR